LQRLTRLRSRIPAKSPVLAVLLSCLLPGLGQAYLGQRKRALIIAIPAIVLGALLVLVLLLDRNQLKDALFSESTVNALLIVNIALLLYRLWAIVDAYLAVRPPSTLSSLAGVSEKIQSKVQAKTSSKRVRSRVTFAVFAAVIITNLGAHLAVGAVGVTYRNQLFDCVFNPNAACWFGGNGNLAAGETVPPFTDQQGATDGPATSSAGISGSPGGSSGASPDGSPTPLPTAGPTTGDGIPIFPVENVSGPNTSPSEWRADGKLNVLLVGADSGTGRWSLRTDTMILLEVDLASGRSVMYGIPRNLENIPLPPESANAFACHCFPYPNLLNALWRDAVNRPSAYPYAGTDFVRGFKALEGAIGQYLGLHVDGSVVINLMGFVHLIDALGGLDMNVPVALKDTQYSRPQDGKDITINIKAGQQHMDGYTALAYARSRHQDSDYGRMSRQQAVLIAIRSQFQPCSILPKVPGLISALGDAFWTDMPVEEAPALAGLAQKIGTGNIKSISLVPAVTSNPVGFLTVPRLAIVRNIAAHALDDVAPVSGGGGGGSGGGGFSC
jgi:LCP family protein required for cell wall assembly